MPRILVIDDQADVRAMICIVLRVNHFEVVEAASAAAGLKEFEASRFDLAIVDIFLQGASGFDVIKMMRERVADLPVVAISGMTALDFVNASPELCQRHLPAEAVSSESSWCARSKRRRRSHPGRRDGARRLRKIVGTFRDRPATKTPRQPGRWRRDGIDEALTSPSD